MWKNVITNFLVLSFIIFSGEYLHYRIKMKVLPEKTAKNTYQLTTNISGRPNKSTIPVVICGVNQTYKTRTYHISGIKTKDSSMSNKVLPSSISDQGNLLISTSS